MFFREGVIEADALVRDSEVLSRRFHLAALCEQEGILAVSREP